MHRYKRYAARVEFGADAHIFVDTVACISDGVGFHAGNATDLSTAAGEAMDVYLAICVKKVAKIPLRPYSGSLSNRVSLELDAKVAIAAELSD